MPQYRVTASFTLTTQIEPDGVRFDYDVEGEDVEDHSYFSAQDVECDGGEVSFTVEAVDEDSAEAVASESFREDQEVEDSNGFTWLITDVSYEVEQIREPMTLDRAQKILSDLARGTDDEGEAYEAVEFVFDHVASVTSNAYRQEQTIRDLSARLQTLEQEVSAARETPFGPTTA